MTGIRFCYRIGSCQEEISLSIIMMWFLWGDKMDNLTKDQRRKNMQHIRSKDTSIEVRLRKALWRKGYRYRKNCKDIPGKPDIALTKYKIAIAKIVSGDLVLKEHKAAKRLTKDEFDSEEWLIVDIILIEKVRESM